MRGQKAGRRHAEKRFEKKGVASGANGGGPKEISYDNSHVELEDDMNLDPQGTPYF